MTGEERLMFSRRACATAIAFAAIAVVPGTAGAHPADCDDTALTKAPAAERFDDWGSSSCRNAAVATIVEEEAAPAAAAEPSNRRKGSFRQIGHEPLLGRGMNAAIAVHGDYAYIGSRTDGGHPGDADGGIMVVDISDPSDPELLGMPFDAKAGESTRELRVWQSQDVLMVLNTNCGVGPTLHHCTQPSISNLRFYDISGRNATDPELLYQFDVDTHEFFLWEDPRDPERALIFAGNASSTCAIRGGAPSCPFSVWDISTVVDKQPPITLYSGLYPYSRYPAAPEPVQKPTGGLHSLTVSNDGRRAYYALLMGGFAIVDTTQFARARPARSHGRSPTTRPGRCGRGRGRTAR
jgi:LVIVD repeat